jgi:hypothetical protein
LPNNKPNEEECSAKHFPGVTRVGLAKMIAIATPIGSGLQPRLGVEMYSEMFYRQVIKILLGYQVLISIDTGLP